MRIAIREEVEILDDDGKDGAAKALGTMRGAACAKSMTLPRRVYTSRGEIQFAV